MVELSVFFVWRTSMLPAFDEPNVVSVLVTKILDFIGGANKFSFSSVDCRLTFECIYLKIVT